MGFKFASFGAATVPLSKIVVDKNLDMRQYSIKAQYRPEEWPTETLNWGDTEETIVFSTETTLSPSTDKIVWTNPSSYDRQIRVTAQQHGSGAAEPVITIDGVEVYSKGVGPATFEAGPFWVPAGKQIRIVSRSTTSYRVLFNFYDTGVVGGPKTFDLTGRWLALGLDMKGLAATVKIQGVEMPYSDYAKYFPLVPTELKIPGGWEPSQERPVIKVYKHA